MALNFRIIYTESVDFDLNEVYYYIFNKLHNPDAAANQLKRIILAVDKLSSNPRIHRVRGRDSHGRELRSFPVDNYVVIYSVDDDKSVVNILHVFYSKRDIDSLIFPEQKS